MPDQTKTRGLQLALNSLESAAMVCKATRSDPAVKIALEHIGLAQHYLNKAISKDQQPPFAGEERREKE